VYTKKGQFIHPGFSFVDSNLATLATVAPSNMIGQSQTLVVTPSQLSSMINGGTLPISSVLKNEVEIPNEEYSNVIKQEPGISSK